MEINDIQPLMRKAETLQELHSLAVLLCQSLSQKATQCKVTGNWYVTGNSGHKYWGHSARAAEQDAQLYFYR